MRTLEPFDDDLSFCPACFDQPMGLAHVGSVDRREDFIERCAHGTPVDLTSNPGQELVLLVRRQIL